MSILTSPNPRHRIDVSCHPEDTRPQPGRRPHFRAGLAVALACILGMTQVTPSEWTEKEATRDTMQVIFESLRFLLQVDASGEDLDSLQLESLQHFRDMPFISDPLQSARDMIDAAGKADFPSPRSALVEYIAASSLLHRYLISRPPDAMDVSEAHYLLGLAEYRIHRDDWLPQAELYLEIAIVLAPDAPWARRAYSLLVDKIHRTYRQSPGGRLPPEVEERLRELKQTVNGLRPSSASVHFTPSERLS